MKENDEVAFACDVEIADDVVGALLALGLSEDDLMCLLRVVADMCLVVFDDTLAVTPETDGTTAVREKMRDETFTYEMILGSGPIEHALSAVLANLWQWRAIKELLRRRRSTGQER
jgi:hypothetical protein